MDSHDIRKYRPTSFKDFVGAKNQQIATRIQNAILQGKPPSPLLVIATFGRGKTSFIRHVLLSINCSTRDPITADPCLVCSQCVCSGQRYFGHGHPYRRHEYDCTVLGRADVCELINTHYFEDRDALFLDELHHLNEKHSQEPLLKFVEEFPGLLFAAVMLDKFDGVIPPLRERFERIQMYPPTSDELVAFFEMKAVEWELIAPQQLIQMMVGMSNGSFRACLKTFAAAAESDRTLTEEILEAAFGSIDQRQGHHGDQSWDETSEESLFAV